MKQFDIFLVRDKRLRSFRLLSWLLLVVNFISLIYFSLKLDRFYALSWAIIIIAALLIFTAYASIKKREWLPEHIQHLPSFVIIIIAWLLLYLPVVAVINALLFVLAMASMRIKKVHVSDEGIHYPSFPAKSIAWVSLSNVILRGGILTIDLKNNHISQEEIDETLSPVNEKEFNDFCREHLLK